MQPETSIDAYKSVNGKMLAEHYQRILSAIKTLENGIYEQIADTAGFTDKNQVSRRLKELEGMELVYKTGNKGLTKSGRQAYQYALRSETTVVPELENKFHEEIVPSDFAAMLTAKTKQQKLVQKDLFNND